MHHRIVLPGVLLVLRLPGHLARGGRRHDQVPQGRGMHHRAVLRTLKELTSEATPTTSSPTGADDISTRSGKGGGKGCLHNGFARTFQRVPSQHGGGTVVAHLRWEYSCVKAITFSNILVDIPSNRSYTLYVDVGRFIATERLVAYRLINCCPLESIDVVLFSATTKEKAFRDLFYFS